MEKWFDISLKSTREGFGKSTTNLAIMKHFPEGDAAPLRRERLAHHGLEES
jgi:hypothetical protein